MGWRKEDVELQASLDYKGRWGNRDREREREAKPESQRFPHRTDTVRTADVIHLEHA